MTEQEIQKLVADHTALRNDYTTLSSDYAELSAKYATIQRRICAHAAADGLAEKADVRAQDRADVCHHGRRYTAFDVLR